MAESETGAGRLDAEAGKTDPRERLALRLARAPLPYLEGALGNPALGEDEILLVLRNRAASGALLARLGRDRRWMRRYAFRRALVLHPKTPYAVSRAFLSHLRWPDLFATMRDAEVPAPIRRDAENLLLIRVEELTLGERINLAHRAPPAILRSLARATEPSLLLAVLGNERLPEEEAVAIAARSGTASRVLDSLSSHPFWRERTGIASALVSNPSTPIAAALRALARLPRRTLERIASEAEVRALLRVAALRRLGNVEEPSPGTPPPGSVDTT